MTIHLVFFKSQLLFTLVHVLSILVLVKTSTGVSLLMRIVQMTVLKGFGGKQAVV